MKRIALIEDDELLLKRMVAFLNSQNNIQCVLCVNSLGKFFESWSEEIQIDVLLIDVELADNINTLDHLQKMAALLPEVKILAITGHNHPAYIQRAMQKGARGFYLKGSGLSKLLEAIEATYHGGIYLAPEAAAHVIPFLQQGGQPQVAASGNSDTIAKVESLSLREKQVAIRLIEGYSYQEIADEIYLSINTIRHYVKVLYEKFEVSNKMQFSKKIRHLLIQEEAPQRKLG